MCDKTQIGTKLKWRQNRNCDSSNCDKTKTVTNSNLDKTQLVTKLK